MRRFQVAVVAAVAFVMYLAPARADVKIEERSRTKLEGVAGKLMGVFGGKAAKEGAVRTVAVKGDRKLVMGETGGELVDLAEEKVYRLDPRKKKYEVVTFAELRKEFEKAQRAAEGEGGDERPEASGKAEPEMEVDLDVKETGEKKTINGFDARQVIVTVTVRRKGTKLEKGGGTQITADTWLAAPRGKDEVADFDQRYYAKLYGDAQVAALRDLAAVLAMQPGLGAGMEKLRAKSGALNGFPVLTTTVVETVKSARELEEERERADADSGGGGLGGMFARAVAKKVSGGGEVRQRQTLLTTEQEVLGVSATVTADDVSVPAGYKEK